MGKNQHVVPHEGQWAVRAASHSKVTSQHATQFAAESAARAVARHQKSEVVIHRRDGMIRDSDSYGNDPCLARVGTH
jgi:hypothetical protein